MEPTVITIDPDVMERLDAYCGGGISYSDAIRRLLDLVEGSGFFASFREAMEDPTFPWIDETDLEWA